MRIYKNVKYKGLNLLIFRILKIIRTFAVLYEKSYSENMGSTPDGDGGCDAVIRN